MSRSFSVLLCFIFSASFSQGKFPHTQAHSHNDYEQEKPLWDALENGFISIEADVHLMNGELLVSHGRPKQDAPSLSDLYLTPIDSLLTRNAGDIYPGYQGTLYLMIDCKTEAVSTFRSIQNELTYFKRLLCNSFYCPVKIFISGNRALDTVMKMGYQGIALDGRPDDLGKGIAPELMPVISDHYSNWSAWKAKSEAQPEDLARIRELAERVHAEGKKLRLWAIPDNEIAWKALLGAGVDLINTDRLSELNTYLGSNGW
jgi:hypothetical protein